MQETDWKSQFMSGLMMPLMGFIGNFAYVAVCVVGAVLAMNGTISFGVIVAFMMYVRLFTSPLSQLAQAATNLQSAAAAAERVFEFLEAKEMPDESHLPAQTKTVRGEVAFDHVRFGYTPDKIIIHDFSEHVQPGQKVAIVGPTGAGKTTMVNLLMKFYPLGGGEIRIDGVPLSQMTREHVHDLFGMVLQDTWLFEGSIRDNLCYGKEGITDEQLDQVTRATGLYHLIHTLPEGYDTLLSDKLNLSAGQKQLMTIARAMIENAPMLILDEATSSVDTRTEMLIQQAMDTLTKGRTSFVIAHRLSTIKIADKILVMRHGDIIESARTKNCCKKAASTPSCTTRSSSRRNTFSNCITTPAAHKDDCPAAAGAFCCGRIRSPLFSCNEKNQHREKTFSHAGRSRPFGATMLSWSKEQLGGAPAGARSYWQGRFAACAFVERVGHTGRPWNSWGVAPNPTRDAVP